MSTTSPKRPRRPVSKAELRTAEREALAAQALLKTFLKKNEPTLADAKAALAGVRKAMKYVRLRERRAKEEYRRVRASNARLQTRYQISYLETLPESVPPGKILVHNNVKPRKHLNDVGFRAWLQSKPLPTYEVCGCGWAPHLGRHYHPLVSQGTRTARKKNTWKDLNA